MKKNKGVPGIKPKLQTPTDGYVGFGTEISVLCSRLKNIDSSHLAVVVGGPGMGVTSFVNTVGHKLCEVRLCRWNEFPPC